MQPNTRKQHYVWGRYLRAWAVDGQLYCLRKGKVFRTPVEGIANQRDFYRVQQLTSNDIKWIIKLFVESGPEESREVARNFLEMFQRPFQMLDMIDPSKPNSGRAIKAIDIAINNIEENYHGSIENDAVPLLEALAQGDAGFLEDDDNAMSFYYFLALQMFRTKRSQERVAARIRENIPEFPFDLAKSWHIIRHILAATFGGGLYVNRINRRIIIKENHNIEPLIVGDQPICNTYPADRNGEYPDGKLELYYPISPLRAVFVTDKPRSLQSVPIELSAEEVKQYNKLIFDNSYEQVYSNRQDALTNFLSELG